MYRKPLCSIFFLAVIILVFSACQKSGGFSKNKEPVVITVWCYYAGAQKNAFDDLVQTFNQTDGVKKGIIVKAVSLSSIPELTKELMNSAKGNPDAQPMPNLFTTYRDTAMEVNAIKPLANIEPYFTKAELAEVYQPFIDEGRFGADKGFRLYPIAKSTEVLILNKTAWLPFAEKTGKTYEDLKTWEGLIETAKMYYEYTDALTPKKNDGKAFFGRDALSNFLYSGASQLAAPITSIVDGKDVVNLDRTVLNTLWKSYYDPYVQGYFFSYGRFASDVMRVGDTVAMVASSASVPYVSNKFIIDDKEVVVELDALPVPNFKGLSPVCVQQGAGIAVVANTKQIEAACCEFLKWFTKSETNLDFALKASYLPVKNDVLNIAKIQDFAARNNVVLSDLMLKTLVVSTEQIKTYSLYVADPIKNGFKIRQTLEKTLSDMSVADAKMVSDKVAAGTDRAVAIKQVFEQNRFEEWFNSISQTVANLSK